MVDYGARMKANVLFRSLLLIPDL